MSSDLETRISLEAFHRHFVVTHMKDKAAGVLDKLERRAGQSGEPLRRLLADGAKCHYQQQTSYQDDSWYVREVILNRHYFAHTDCRRRASPTAQPFVHFMNRRRH